MDVHVGHLRYDLYKRVQDYIHAGYVHQKAILTRTSIFHRAGAAASPRVLELACGGGSLAEVFPAESYTGIDASAERVAAARRDQPSRSFEVCEVDSPALEKAMSGSDFIFCHGLLHHIDDRDCAALLDRLARNARRPATFVAIEPLLPEPWRNPLGYLVGKLDEGRYFRSSAGYRRLFQGLDFTVERFSLLPRLPLDMEAFVVRWT
jgi:SAM-dependent methyltransferase